MIDQLRNLLAFARWPIRHPIAAFAFYVLRRPIVITPSDVATQHFFTDLQRFDDGAVEPGSETITEAMVRSALDIRYDVTMPTKRKEP